MEKKNKKIVNKNKCHPELDSGSSTLVVSQGNSNNVRGRFQIKFGMTSLFDNDYAFTLIELLVVVLIIGILAAVALPQYQKAVLKSRITQVVAYLKAVKDAEEVYYLANGEYTADMDSLSVDGSCPKDWTCQLMADNNIPKVEAGYDSWKLAVVSSFDRRDDVPEWAGIMYCFARTGNPKYDQACKSMGTPIPNGISASGTRYYIGK